MQILTQRHNHTNLQLWVFNQAPLLNRVNPVLAATGTPPPAWHSQAPTFSLAILACVRMLMLII